MTAIADAVMGRFFCDAFRAAHPAIVETFRHILLRSAPQGYAGCCAALREADLSGELGKITAPTLVIGGRLDASTPPAQAETLANGITGARLTVLDTAHLSNIEQPAAFHRSRHKSSGERLMDEAERHKLGMTTRRSVLGDAHVDRAVANATPFTAEFQDLITRLAWGEIWTRPAIDHPTRRLLTIAMLIALNRGDEFKMHVRAALNMAWTRTLSRK